MSAIDREAHLSRGSSLIPADAAACGLSTIRLHRCTDRGCKLATRDRSCKRTCTDHPWGKAGAPARFEALTATTMAKDHANEAAAAATAIFWDHGDQTLRKRASLHRARSQGHARSVVAREGALGQRRSVLCCCPVPCTAPEHGGRASRLLSWHRALLIEAVSMRARG